MRPPCPREARSLLRIARLARTPCGRELLHPARSPPSSPPTVLLIYFLMDPPCSWAELVPMVFFPNLYTDQVVDQLYSNGYEDAKHWAAGGGKVGEVDQPRRAGGAR